MQPADADEVGARRDRLDDVGAAADPAIHHDLGAALHGVDDLGQHMHGAAAVIELAAAMVGDVDPLDAVIDRDLRVLGGGDALEDQRYLELVLDHLHGPPLQPLLEIAASGAQAAFANVALGDVTLTTAVMGGVDGQAEGGIVGLLGAADDVGDECVIAADIELVHAQRIGGGLGGLLQTGLGDRAQHVRRAEGAGRARDAGGAIRVEDFQRTDGGEHHRQAHLAAELLDRAGDLAHVAQHTRAESDLVQGHAVAAHRGLGLGGADDVVPGVLVEVGTRLPDEFVQVLERLVAGAEFDVPFRPECFVHCYPPENLKPYVIGYLVRPSKTILKSHSCEAWLGRSIPDWRAMVSERCQKFRPGRRDFCGIPAGVAARP